jgi:hypothetical protein
VPPEPLFAPFTIDLVPGEYMLECDNGGITRATTFPLKVDAPEGRTQFFTRTMPGFNAVKIVDALLGQD